MAIQSVWRGVKFSTFSIIMSVSIAVIGGGIGGAAATLSLLSRGIDAHLFERGDHFSELGAGLQLSPNATRILHSLGLEEELRMCAVEPTAWHQRRWRSGETLSSVPLSTHMKKRYGYPYYHILRTDLLDALTKAIPQDRVHLGYEMTDMHQERENVEVTFSNGQTFEFDGMIGADGIRSRVRSFLFGDVTPCYSGCIAYRGLIDADRIAKLKLPTETQVWLGPGKHLVTYYVQRHKLLNFVAVIDRPEANDESWVMRGEVDSLRAEFAGWHPMVVDLVHAAQETFCGGIFDHQPMPCWTRGTVTLLGDACHSMVPFMAQGAGQAIEDAAVLGRCVQAATRSTLAGCLKSYETIRRPRTQKICNIAAGLKDNLHFADGPDQMSRDQNLGSDTTSWGVGDLDWLYGYNAFSAGPPSALVTSKLTG
jgi:salicylate hydroxylase